MDLREQMLDLFPECFQNKHIGTNRQIVPKHYMDTLFGHLFYILISKKNTNNIINIKNNENKIKIKIMKNNNLNHKYYIYIYI